MKYNNPRISNVIVLLLYERVRRVSKDLYLK